MELWWSILTKIFLFDTQTLTSSPVDPLHIDSTSGNNGEITMGVQDDKTITPGDALTNNQEKEESHTSVEEIQNLAGGADIKVLSSLPLPS